MSPNSTNQFHKHEPYSHTLGDDLTIPGVKCGELAIQRPRKAFVWEWLLWGSMPQASGSAVGLLSESSRYGNAIHEAIVEVCLSGVVYPVQ